MIYTTLNKIRAYSPCESSWVKLLGALDKTSADDEPLPVAKILEICGLQDAFWSLRTLPEHNRKWRLLACDYAERTLPIWDAKYPDDRRPHECIAVARRFANGEATAEELDAARAAAGDAARAVAGAAAGAVAGAAAGATERAWQTQRFLEYLEGDASHGIEP